MNRKHTARLWLLSILFDFAAGCDFGSGGPTVPPPPAAGAGPAAGQGGDLEKAHGNIPAKKGPTARIDD
jgi:hypothetical protein